MAIHRSPASLAHRRRLPTMATAPRRRKFESNDTALLREGLASLPSSRPSVSDCAHPRPVEGGTVVTSPDSDEEEEEEVYDSPLEQEEDEDGSEFSSDAVHGVPAEVAVSYDNDGPGRERDSDDEGSELEDNAVDSDDDDEEEEELTPEDLYATDDDGGIGSDRSLQDDDDDDDASTASASVASQHALFLPHASPSVESLKYDEDGDDDNSSSDEDDDEDHTTHYSHRTYMIGRTGRPRMWDGCPSGVSVSSGSSSSSDGSRASQASSRRKATKAAGGVSFDPAVTVYPVFATSAYPPAMVERMYTGRDELKANKLRNKREYAYDGHDWRHAAEEGDMAPNADGELVHPVHGDGERSRSPSPPPPPLPAASSVGPCKTRNAVRTYAAAVGGYRAGGGGGTVHRAKRMRMYYP